MWSGCRFTRAFKGLIFSPPSEPPGEIMSFGVSPVNYSDAVVSQAYSGYAEICPGFPPPQTALAITACGRGTLGRMVQ